MDTSDVKDAVGAAFPKMLNAVRTATCASGLTADLASRFEYLLQTSEASAKRARELASSGDCEGAVRSARHAESHYKKAKFASSIFSQVASADADGQQQRRSMLDAVARYGEDVQNAWDAIGKSCKLSKRR